MLLSMFQPGTLKALPVVLHHVNSYVGFVVWGGGWWLNNDISQTRERDSLVKGDGDIFSSGGGQVNIFSH